MLNSYWYAKHFIPEQLITGASAVYSLRLLVRNYTGPVLRVRRIRDSLNNNPASGDVMDMFTIFADIYINNNKNVTKYVINGQVQSTPFVQWVGDNVLYVMQWYDQSGDQYHMSQPYYQYQPTTNATFEYIDFGTAYYIENNQIKLRPNMPYNIQYLAIH